LLASPRYGERWARHWLDVAHYADTHGQDQDRPRPNSWPYRDYLIRSFNADKPYSRFVQEQVAGDALFPADPDAIVATGFLAAGPWDESSLRDIQENSLDREIARYLDRDDIVTSVMSTFVSSTVGCARCHDHKFDPISQEDYYALQAVFSGVDKSDRAYDADPIVARRRVELLQSQAQLKAWKGKSEPSLLSPENQAIAAEFEKLLTSTNQKWVILDPIEVKSSHGATLKELPDHSVLSTGMRPEKDTYTITLGTDLTKLTGLKLEVLSDDGLPMKGPGRQDNGNLHLSEVRVRIGSTNVKLQNPVADFDQDGWAIPRAIDGNLTTAWGIYPAIGQPHQAVFEFADEHKVMNGVNLTVELDQLHGGGHLIGRFRLSVTSSPRPLSLNAKPISAELQSILTSNNRTDAQRAELARLAELPDAVLSRFRTGETNLRGGNLDRLCKALNMELVKRRSTKTKNRRT